MKRLILVGGGHSHVEVLRRFALAPPTGVELTLLSPGRFTPYSGMLPGLIAGHYSPGEMHIDLTRLSAAARARLVSDRAVGLELGAKRVRCAGGETLAYDLISLDIGSAPPMSGTEASVQRAIPVKPVERLLAAWGAIQSEATTREVQIVVIGGGAGGVELTLAMEYRLRALGALARLLIVTDSDSLLSGHAGGVRRRLERVLRERGVMFLVGSRVAAVEAGSVHLADGNSLSADYVVWATGAAAPSWPRESGLATDAAGFVLVGETLQSRSHPEVFAAGDIATMEPYPRPKSGVYAVRQGPPLAENLRRALGGDRLSAYHPQPIVLALISTGARHAIASWGALAWEGDWVWRWKDRIDRRFVRRYAV